MRNAREFSVFNRPKASDNAAGYFIGKSGNQEGWSCSLKTRV
jgi:hypothetical protein